MKVPGAVWLVARTGTRVHAGIRSADGRRAGSRLRGRVVREEVVVRVHRVGLLAVGVGLLAASFGLGIAGNRDRHDRDRDRQLVEQATIQSQLLSEY